MDIDRELEELAALAASPAKLAEVAPRLLAIARTARQEELRRTRQLRLVFDLTHAVSDAREVGPLVERVLASIHGALSVDTALLHLAEGEVLVLAGRRVSPSVAAATDEKHVARFNVDGASLIGRAGLHRRTMTVDLTAASTLPPPPPTKLSIRYAMATPLVIADRLVGTLTVTRCAGETFTADEVQLIESCAGHIAVAVAHARLFEEERRRMLDLRLINELGSLISQHLELSAVLSTGVRNLARIADVPNAFLFLVDEKRGDLHMVATNLANPTDLEVRVPLDQSSATAHAVHELRPIVIASCANDSRAHRTLNSQYGQRSLLAVPLISGGRALGAVLLAETRMERVFSGDEVGRAVAVANQLATAIAHAKMFADLRTSYDQLARAQAELVTHERLAALGELAAVMAHEVRNPLAVIYNSLGSLRKLLQPTGDACLLLDMAGQEAERLNRIVSDLLDFAKPYEPILRSVDLEPLVRGAVDAASRAVENAGVALVVDIASNAPRLELDSHMLRQALVNLVVNALQATPKGRCVTVRASVEERGRVCGARVEVIDEGAGILPGNVDRIFQPFFTTKATGTGLGLAVVRRIVDAHRGEIVVSPDARGGTAFSVWLPSAVPRPSF